MTENYLVVAMLAVVAFGLEIHRQVLERADLEPAARRPDPRRPCWLAETFEPRGGCGLY
jgi:hypothetical protein